MNKNLLFLTIVFLFLSCKKSSNNVCVSCIAYDIIDTNPNLAIGAPVNQEENCGEEEELEGWEDKYSTRFEGSRKYIYCTRVSGKDTLTSVNVTR